MARSPYRVLIVDDHTIDRQGLRSLLSQREGLVVVGDVPSREAFERAVELQPEIVVLDLDAPDVDEGVRLIGKLRERVPGARVIALTALIDTSDVVFRVIRAGANAFLPKTTCDIDELDGVIRKVAEGQTVLSPTSLLRLVASLGPGARSASNQDPEGLEELSPREYDVLFLVAQGHTNRQIAEQLFISESTVRTHLHNILEKRNLTNRVQATAYALRTHSPASAKKKVPGTMPAAPKS